MLRDVEKAPRPNVSESKSILTVLVSYMFAISQYNVTAHEDRLLRVGDGWQHAVNLGSSVGML